MSEYLVELTLREQEKRRKRRKVWGIILAALFGFGLFGGIFDADEGLREGIPLYAVLFLLGLFLVYRGMQIKKWNELARSYGSIFSGDTDGIVSIRELTTQSGKEAEQVRKELDFLFRKEYFQKCTLQQSGEIGVRLFSTQPTNAGGFVTVQCKNCGASNRIRRGSTGRCEYCGSHFEG